MKENDKKHCFIELRAQGFSFDKISKELKVAKSTLILWSKEFELEIANLKAVEMEGLLEKHFMSKKARIELFGKQIIKIKEELGRRDFSDISTEKLFDLLVKYVNQLKQEEMKVEFSRWEKQDIMDSFKNLETKLVKWTAN
ncbi:hypothetical protein [Priestia megaterium]|uniref:hypothetical protein n=1 Tax=Priestia megaterium TaxID=1404 RepID=UPI001FB3995A|nr:hypothetical protein [Priestia megaterium]